MRKWIWLVGLACLPLLACQKPPTAEIDRAHQALSGAESAEAATYAAPQLDEARSAMDAVEQEVAKQEAKFSLFRSYDQTRTLIGQAEEKAEAARLAAVEGKAKARQEAEQARAHVQTQLDEADAALAALATCRRQPKGFASDLEALRGRVDALKTGSGEVQKSLDGEQYTDATASAEALSEQLDALLADLQGARDKLGC